LGQKVHPLGFRLVSTQKHHSIWFAKFKSYQKLILEDSLIRNFLESQSRKAGIAKIEIKRNSSTNKIEVTIYSARPGLFVGTSGIGLTLVYETLNRLINKKRNLIIDIVGIKKPNTEANLIADSIVDQLEKRVVFRRAIQNAIKRANSENILGIKIEVSGRLNGADMARSEWVREGRVPLQTLRANIDYAEKRAKTIYGTVGIKVWLFKGDIL
jgi:small subunit ribosomal protein S3